MLERGHGKEAFHILVDQLEDFDAAEQLCSRLLASNPTLYLALLQAYVARLE
jgi:hypothetical protein